MKEKSTTKTKTSKTQTKSGPVGARKHTSTQTRDHISYPAILIDHISDALISTDGEFKIRVWNLAAENRYGWTAAEEDQNQNIQLFTLFSIYQAMG